MRAVVVYKEESDHAREVIDYLADFTRQTGRELEVIDPETADGAMFCRTYDIVEYPSIIALSNDGALQNLWRGRPLPTISEVSYYVED
jgi:hypothetical protein